MTPQDLSGRIDRIEASLAHLDRLVEQLNEALVEQGRHLVRLQKRVDQLAETVESRDAASNPMPIERPPHYGR